MKKDLEHVGYAGRPIYCS